MKEKWQRCGKGTYCKVLAQVIVLNIFCMESVVDMSNRGQKRERGREGCEEGESFLCGEVQALMCSERDEVEEMRRHGTYLCSSLTALLARSTPRNILRTHCVSCARKLCARSATPAREVVCHAGTQQHNSTHQCFGLSLFIFLHPHHYIHTR